MKKLLFIGLGMLGLWAGLFSCTNEPVIHEKLDASLGIEAVPISLGNDYTSNFDRYTKVIAPNGGHIHIVAQVDISNEKIVRCRSVLEHYLKNYENSKYGNDKGDIANKMADNNAVLLLMNGYDGQYSVDVDGQPLYDEEIQIEGHDWYINQDYEHRDATYEEILHFVHDNGIGVDGHNSMPGAAPNFQAEIRAAQKNASSNNLWGMGATKWIEELTEENSLSQEYLAAVIDVYYGLWGAATEFSTTGMYDLYVAKVRADIPLEDPVGQGLLEHKFFHPYLTYNARIDSSFNDVFTLRFDPSKAYTHHSRYLKDITLLGTNNAGVLVNELDNDITGNEGVNCIIFSGSSSEYTITTSNEVTTINDQIANRDGFNTVRNIERLQFVDKTISL